MFLFQVICKQCNHCRDIDLCKDSHVAIDQVIHHNTIYYLKNPQIPLQSMSKIRTRLDFRRSIMVQISDIKFVPFWDKKLDRFTVNI